MNDEELELVKTALRAMQARNVAAFSAADPAIDALLEKLEAPAPEVEPEQDPTPARKKR